MLSRLNQLGLRFKAAVLILGVVFVCLMVTTTIGVIEGMRFIKREHYYAADRSAWSLAIGCELPLAVGDQLELARLISRHLDSDGVEFVLVLDPQGQTVLFQERESGNYAKYRQVIEEQGNVSSEYLIARHDVVVDTSGAHRINGLDAFDWPESDRTNRSGLQMPDSLRSSTGNYELYAPEQQAYGDDPKTIEDGLNHSRSPSLPNHQWQAPKHGDQLGSVVMGYSTQALRDDQRAIVMKSVFAALASGLLGLPLTLVLMRAWVQRLNRLLIASDRLADGDLNTPIKDPQQDEIGRLAMGFEQMRVAIADKHKELATFNEKLQLRVEEKTKALNKSVALTRGILHSAADGVVTIDPNGCVGVFNPAAERIFGVTVKQVRGKPFSALFDTKIQLDQKGDLLYHRPDGRQVTLGHLAEIDACRPDQTRVPIQISLAKLRIGDQLHNTAIVRDITEKRQAQAEHAAMVGQLLKASRSAGMAEVASGVLHNVGNVLNSINVGVQMIVRHTQGNAIKQLKMAAGLVSDHRENLVGFIADDPRGKHLPDFLDGVSQAICDQQESIVEEARTLNRHVEHVKRIIKTQQSYAKTAALAEPTDLAELFEDAYRINKDGLLRHDIVVKKEFESVNEATIDKHACLQILVNLIRNARNAMESIKTDRQVTLRIQRNPENPSLVQLQVQDTGIGIAEENITRIFSHGFTTRKEGNGFGLHSAALAAEQMGGSLSVSSDGEGCGACFTLELPFDPADAVEPENKGAENNSETASDDSTSLGKLTSAASTESGPKPLPQPSLKHADSSTIDELQEIDAQNDSIDISVINQPQQQNISNDDISNQPQLDNEQKAVSTSDVNSTPILEPIDQSPNQESPNQSKSRTKTDSNQSTKTKSLNPQYPQPDSILEQEDDGECEPYDLSDAA